MKGKYLIYLMVFTAICLPLISACTGDITIETDENKTSGSTLTGVVSASTDTTLTVSDVEFVTSNATFISDGSTDFGPGAVVTIEGAYSNRRGVAHRIKYDSELEGVVISSDITAVPAVPNTESTDPMTYEGSMNVMGQSIIIDSMTTFKNLDDPTTILKGNTVEISGMFAANGVIRAKRVEYKTDVLDANEEIELKGYVSAYDETASTFMIGECVVVITPETIFTDIDILEDDMKVEVESIGENIQVDSICSITALEIHNEDHNGFRNMAMTKGLVVAELLDNIFMLQQGDNDPIKAMIDNNTHFVNGTADDIVEGTRLKSIGQYNENDVFMARLIKFDNVDPPVIVYGGSVESIVLAEPTSGASRNARSDGEITVLGQTISVTADTNIFLSAILDPMPIPMPQPGNTGGITTIATHPEIRLTLADINLEDYVMIIAYFDDIGVLTARVIGVRELNTLM